MERVSRYGESHTTNSRGNLFVRIRNSGLRPPWTNQALVREHCTSCGDCIKACPEGILTSGPAGTPNIDFAAGACTFCGECAASCQEGVFRDTDLPPWTMQAAVGEGCLLNAGISCQSCTDACDETALSFNMRAGSVGRIDVMADRCTACGACVSVCPVRAIDILPGQELSA